MTKYQFLLKKKKAENWAFSSTISSYPSSTPSGWTSTPTIWSILRKANGKCHWLFALVKAPSVPHASRYGRNPWHHCDLCHFLFSFLLMVIILFCSPRYSAGLSSVHLRRMLSGIWILLWVVYLPVAPRILFRKTPLVSGFRFCLYVPFSVRAFLHDLLPAVLTEIVSVPA